MKIFDFIPIVAYVVLIAAVFLSSRKIISDDSVTTIGSWLICGIFLWDIFDANGWGK